MFTNIPQDHYSTKLASSTPTQRNDAGICQDVGYVADSISVQSVKRSKQDATIAKVRIFREFAWARDANVELAKYRKSSVLPPDVIADLAM